MEETRKRDSAVGLYEWIEALLLAILFVVLVFTFLWRVVTVDGPSMQPTLHNGDKLVLYSQAYQNPQQGDIVVITQPNSRNEPLIKRIIAKEGQTVDIDFELGTVTVDGTVLQEDYIQEPTYNPTSAPVSFPLTVPKGCIFVLGDNRNNSTDSRSQEIGLIDERYILGKAVFRLFPINSFGTVN